MRDGDDSTVRGGWGLGLVDGDVGVRECCFVGSVADVYIGCMGFSISAISETLGLLRLRLSSTSSLGWVGTAGAGLVYWHWGTLSRSVRF